MSRWEKELEVEVEEELEEKVEADGGGRGRGGIDHRCRPPPETYLCSAL